MAGGGATPVARGLAAAAGVAPVHAALLQRIAASPGLDALVAEVGALELLASGRPLFMLPARITVK
jgi:hypothetical protein